MSPLHQAASRLLPPVSLSPVFIEEWQSSNYPHLLCTSSAEGGPVRVQSCECQRPHAHARQPGTAACRTRGVGPTRAGSRTSVIIKLHRSVRRDSWVRQCHPARGAPRAGRNQDGKSCPGCSIFLWTDRPLLPPRLLLRPLKQNQFAGLPHRRMCVNQVMKRSILT